MQSDAHVRRDELYGGETKGACGQDAGLVDQIVKDSYDTELPVGLDAC